MRLTKKTFAPNINLKVVDKSFKFCNVDINTLIGFEGEMEDCTPKDETLMPIGTVVTTVKMVNFMGSMRIVYTANGKEYWSFLQEFTKLTEIL